MIPLFVIVSINASYTIITMILKLEGTAIAAMSHRTKERSAYVIG